MAAKRRGWTEEEIKLFNECVKNKCTWAETARILGRMICSVISKAKQLGVYELSYKKPLSVAQEIEKCLNCQKPECTNCLYGQ